MKAGKGLCVFGESGRGLIMQDTVRCVKTLKPTPVQMEIYEEF